MLVSFLATLLLSGILIFDSAGRLNWTLGWIFNTAWIVPKLVFLTLLRWLDPDLLVERATRHKNTQRYDRIILPIYFVSAFGTFIVAGLDGGRFRWSDDVSIIWVITAYIIYLLGNSLTECGPSNRANYERHGRSADQNDASERRHQHSFY